jgi:hypothetical protein
MEMRRVRGTAPGERRQKLFFDFGEQWSALLGDYNWYDFTLIDLGGEWTPSTGRFEVVVWLLGVGMRITYVYDNSFNEEMLSMREQLEAEIKLRTGAEVHDPFGVLHEISKRDNEGNPS